MALFGTDYALGLRSLSDKRWKLIHEVELGRSKHFDLEADLDERCDLAGQEPDRVGA
jgi:hypothetical protein